MSLLKLDKILKATGETEREWVNDSFALASRILADEKRSNGDPFTAHLTNVAEIIALEIGLMPAAVAAFFLHEATRSRGYLPEEFKKMFPEEVLVMAEGLNKISQIKPRDTGLQAENYRKLILTYSRDPRVTLIKLADRLEIMRSLEMFSKSKQLQKSTETMMLYAPLAHQLGLYNIKSELEDLSFRYTDPENYRLISNKLKTGEQERKRLADIFVKPIELGLKRARIKYQLKSRTKTAYSIFSKMQRQHIPFEAVAALFAIRFIIDSAPENEQELCWKVYSIVTENYTPDISRLRDWITVPKPNGYESLHTTVNTSDGQVVEVQIRTARMDYIAENGYASHTGYKGIKIEQGVNQWLNKVKKLLESGGVSMVGDEDKYVSEEVFVFTPNGDLRRLPTGASVLDFAFDIHTNLGVKCSGAKINGKPVSIRERLKTGDVVEVMSSRNQKPSVDWLNYVVTSKARARIKQKLNEESGKRAEEGRELLERRMTNWKLDLNDVTIGVLLKHYKYKTASDFYVALASEDIDISEIKPLLTSKDSTTETKEPTMAAFAPKPYKAKQGTESDYLIINEKVNNVGFKLSKCCNPIMGDEVFGFVTIKEGIKIHRLSCPNASRLITNYPYRIQKVKWRESQSGNSFQTTLRISGYDEQVAGQEIIEIISSLNISLRQFTMTGQKGKLEAKVQVAVSNNQQLDKLIFNLKKIKGVKSVNRISNFN